MTSLQAKGIACVASLAFVSGCASISENEPSYENPYADEPGYGESFDVLSAIGTIKREGNLVVLSSTAVRLPERPLSNIDSYSLKLPTQCGGHEFVLLETGDTQILEFHFAADTGDVVRVRDYISNGRPFVQAGLWGAYDHTVDGLQNMSSRVEDRGDSVLAGSYSQGFVSSLPQVEKDAIGFAYAQALSDTSTCSVVSSTID